MLTQKQIDYCKVVLKDRQSTLITQTEEGNDRSIMLTEMSGELSSYDNHPADMGTALYDRGKDQALERHAEKELEKINEALHAMEDGAYGFCSVCGVDIGFERLKIVPTAAQCKEHAEEQSDRETSVDHHTFQPHIGLREQSYEAFEEDGRPNAWSEVAMYGTSTSTPVETMDETDSYDF